MGTDRLSSCECNNRAKRSISELTSLAKLYKQTEFGMEFFGGVGERVCQIAHIKCLNIY